MNDNCNKVNTVWIDKGIVLTIMYYLIKKDNNLQYKNIIIDITRYRILFKKLFPKLKFSKFETDDKNNFYFNIRKIIKKQDIVIDYLSNYDDYIMTKKIKLVPWFDMNDVLISYKYNSAEKLYVDKYLNFIINFNKCRRGNYNNQVYDKYIEDKILNLYLKFNTDMTLTELNNDINKYIYEYTDTVNTFIVPITEKSKLSNNRELKNEKQNIANDKQNIDNDKQYLLKEIRKRLDKIKSINLKDKPEVEQIVKEIIVEKPDLNIVRKYNELKQQVNNAVININNQFKIKDDAINTLLDTLNTYVELINQLQQK